jgi:alpha-glucosidase
MHCPSTKSMYSSHPFLIIDSDIHFGLLIDYPSKIVFDVGYSDYDTLKITIPSKDFNLYIFKSEDNLGVIREYLKLSGSPFVPPKWAFGYQQSRWSYPTKDVVKEVAEKFREKGIPCDSVYLDLDYMDNYKIFTTSEERFEDFNSFVKSLKDMGFKLVPIIDPGVKIEKGYEVYESGMKNDVFCKDENGQNFIGAVWPGWVNFPDFLDKNVRRWWGDLYKRFVDIGINSFWNDMNEPSIFYTPESLKKALKVSENVDQNLAIENLVKLSTIEQTLHGSEIYKKFYHLNGKVNHDKVHNLYGFYMAKATADGLKKLSDERYFLLSRSTCIGAHTFTGLWTGDNRSWWEHLEMNVKMLMSLNMVGFFYNGADIGGFGDNCNPELLIRWIQLGVFSPLFRNHSAIDTIHQEPWSFDEKTEDIIKESIKFRYSLIEYIYSQYMQSVKNLKPLIRPIFFDFDDKNSKEIEDQFMFGDSLMVAPIYRSQVKGRVVYLPKDKWLLWKVKNHKSRNLKVLEKGYNFIQVKLDEMLIFIKKGSFVILSEPMNFVGEKNVIKLTALGFVENEATLTYYTDNGVDYSFENGLYCELKIRVKRAKDDFEAEIIKMGEFDCKIKTIEFEIYDIKGNLHKFVKKI